MRSWFARMKTSGSPSWEDLRVLLSVARTRSFLAAGRALGLSTSTVARRISALEQQLGMALVARGAAGATVEASATAFLALAERIEIELAAAAREARRQGDSLAGTVRISVGEGSAPFVADAMARFRQEHPETFVELAVEWRMADLARREADIAIRLAPTRSAATVARKMGELTFALYGSREYLRRARVKRARAGDFGRYDFVSYDTGHDDETEMGWLRGNGATRFTFLSTSLEGILAGVNAGHGLALLPELLAQDNPALARVPTDDLPPPVPVYLAYARERRNVPRVRAIVDHLRTELTARLAVR